MSGPAINTVLVIDDSADYRKLMVSFFKKVSPTARVDEYDPVYERPPENFPWSKYDLLILDYDLGKGENGLEWLRQCKTSSGFPPTIMLTAADSEELVVNALRFGADGFLRKSGLTKNVLIEAINSALKKHQQEKKAADTQKIQVHMYNREKFFDSLKSVKKNNAIFLIEIDKFQELHELLGIFAIDNFVNYFAETISNTVKQNNYAGQMTRIGDSTVALLIQNELGTANSEKLAKLLCDTFDKNKYKHNGHEIGFSVNIGVKCIDGDQGDVAKILTRVENACRRAREASGNSYIIEGDIDEKQAEYEKELLNRVKAAITENRIRPLFQTLVLVSGTAEKAFREIHQVRVNILDKEQNVIEPKKFVPVLEKFDSLALLDRWIIRHCIQELAKLRINNNLDLGIMIPLSAQSINDKDLTDWIHEMVGYVKIPDLGKSLIFEIKARDVLAFSRQAKLQFNKFRVKLGASIALTNINDVPMLDKCMNHEKFNFIIFSPEHSGDRKMPIDLIQQMVNKAREHNAYTVASRIDTGEYLALVASAGTDYVLGHFVQPPMEKIVPTEEVVVR